MSTLDFSANMCHPLSMPFKRARDPRKRLDARVGASCDIYNSRLYVYGGCVLPIRLSADYTLASIKEAIEKEIQGESPKRSFNDYLSSECFTLSLVNRSWSHFKVTQGGTDDDLPRARMFHSSAVHDGYIYIRGGIAFDANNDPILLNDLWRFDTIDRKWDCYYKDGNSDISKALNDLSVYTSGLDLIDRPTRCGFMSVGGLPSEDCKASQVSFFDLVEKKIIKHNKCFVVSPALKKTDTSSSILKPLNSKDAIIGIECDARDEILFLIYNKSPNPETHYPLITIHKDGTANRLPAADGVNLDIINNLEYPTLGKFGKNFVVVGFEKGKDKLSSFVYNYPTNLWTKLNISCMHKANTHKLSMGFVWGSHHKVIFLGTKTFANQPQSVQFFDIMVVLALPFTNIFSADVYKSQINTEARNSVSLSRSPSLNFNNDVKVPEKVNSFNNLNMMANHQAIPPLVSHLGPGSQGLSGGFAEYSHHVAQQIQVNSIQTILPPYAIAIGKDAFQRADAFSDFSMVCADGTVVPGQFTLCRRRWGPAFDVMLADAYAKALAEEKLREHERQNNEPSLYSKSSHSATSCDLISIASRSSDAAPHFRYPFKEKDQATQAAPSNDGDDLPSSRKNSIRRTSLTYVTPNPAAQRASISLSQSRRNSYNVGSPSRHNSISIPSRKNSLTLRQQYLPNSRRGSGLSRTSVISSTSTSSIASPNFKPAYASSNDVSLPVMTPITNSTEHREQPMSSKVNPNDDVFVKYLPETLPMPDVLPTGEKPHDDTFETINLGDIFATKINPQSLGTIGDPGDSKSPSGSTSQQGNNEKSNAPSTPNANAFSFSQNVSPSANGDVTCCNCNNGYYFNAETNIHFGKLPRALFLPFSRPTVLALNEYLYSGQVGATWRLFPTAIELLVASRRLGIPLLYDLLLDILFVVLGLMENMINNKIAVESVKRDLDVTMCEHAGVGDYDLYCQLLFNFSKEIRRTSGSTLGSSFVELDDNEQLEQEANMSILQDDDLGPTDGGFEIKSNLSKEGLKNDTGDNADQSSFNNSLSDFPNVKFKVALSLLDESGFDTSASEENDSDDSFDDRFKRFTMRDEKSDKRKSSKVRTMEWPTVKEILSENSKFLASRTLIDIFVELGTLINDSNLLVRALHVKELHAKLDGIKSEKSADSPRSSKGSLDNSNVHETCTMKKDQPVIITPVNSEPPFSASPLNTSNKLASMRVSSAKLSPFSTNEEPNDDPVVVGGNVPIAKSKTTDFTTLPNDIQHHHHVHTVPHMPPPTAPKLMKSAKSFKGVVSSFMPKENDSVDELFGSVSMRPSMSQTSLHKKPRGFLSRFTGRNKN